VEKPSASTIRACEDRAFRAWPAAACVDTSGWILRYTENGPNRRSNSVCPNLLNDGVSVDGLMIEVESFYEQRGLPARYQISPANEPSDLDDRLQSRGYEIEAPVFVQWASCAGVLSGMPSSNDVHVSDTPNAGWLAVHGTPVKNPEHLIGLNGIFKRINHPKAHAVLNHNGEPAAIALGVYEDGWCGIFCMFTLPAFRGLGLANQILGAMAQWTIEQGGANMYLQVEKDNPVALSFYGSRGFSTAYSYHYRTQFN
jgi:N-acetylglutamate synthase